MKNKTGYKVQIKVGDTEVNVEGAESGVVKTVEALTNILQGPRKPAGPSVSAPTSMSVPSLFSASPRPSSADIRSFFEEKQPSSDIEAAAVAAYYTQYLAPEADRRNTIDSAGLQEAFRRARRPLPARTIYTLTNARNAGYLDSVGRHRISWKLFASWTVGDGKWLCLRSELTPKLTPELLAQPRSKSQVVRKLLCNN